MKKFARILSLLTATGLIIGWVIMLKRLYKRIKAAPKPRRIIRIFFVIQGEVPRRKKNNYQVLPMLLFAIFAITWMVLIGSLISSLTNSVATASATPTVIATESPVAEQPVNAPVEPVIAEPAEPAPLPTESATPIEPVPWKPTLLNHQENFDGFRLKEVSSCDTLFFVFPDHSVWVGKKTRLTQGVEITGTPVLIGENRCAGPRGGWVWTTTLPMANQGVSWFKISLNDQGVSTLWWTGSVYGKEVVTRNSMTYAGDLDQPYRDIARWIEENAQQYLSFPLRRDWGQAVTHFNQ